MDFKINGFQIKHSGLLQFLTTTRERNSVASNVKLELVQSMCLLKLLPYLREGLNFLACDEKRKTHYSGPYLLPFWEPKYSVNTK